MFAFSSKSNCNRRILAALVILLALGLASPVSMYGSDKDKKKKAAATQPETGPKGEPLDISKLVWPNPPNIARVKWLNYYAGMKIDYTPPPATKPKQSWMDRVAGNKQVDNVDKLKTYPWQMLRPYGIAIDSKGLVYVADQKVGAVFIFNTETRDATLIKNGTDAHFALINGVAIDDADRLFVSDGQLHRVLVLNPQHKVEGQIAEGLVDPVGMAIDNENRFLYVVDEQQDLVLVYDADSLKLLRHIGVPGKKHASTAPGEFGGASNVALDKDGNVYVTDTMNNRVEIFDAEGTFISQFGKHGDGPGFFARPKGIAVDCDGHIWVADQYQDRLQVFNREGELLTYIGDQHSNGVGQFKALVGVAIDKQNRVFTTEQYPGRMQMFRYVTDDEAAVEKAKRETDLKAAADARRGVSSNTAPKPAETPAPSPAATAPAQKPADAPAQKPAEPPPSPK
jgi:DNA-binding beta-propeller fold protein YncE